MAKLSKEQAEEAIKLREEGKSYRGIEDELKEEYGEGNVPAFTTISTKIKPVLNGNETLDEAFSEGGKQNENKEAEHEKVERGTELEIEPEKEHGESDKSRENIILAILWTLFLILVLVLFVI